VWFELTLPAGGYYSDNITLEFTITPPPGTSGSADTSVATADVISPIARSSPQTKFEKGAPPNFLRLNRKNKANPSLSWSIWEWAGGSFIKNTYRASLDSTAALSPDETAGYKSLNSSTRLWTTRSGYGLNTMLNVSVQNLPGMIAGMAKADVFYPEYNYTTSATYSDNLLFNNSASSGGIIRYNLTFPVDLNSISKNKMHKTPVWFPDGEYTVNYSIFDVWTPAGELTASNYAMIMIDGNMYDDSYVKPLKPNN
jgi:hypothetical protein